jgi:hypothetical protein
MDAETETKSSLASDKLRGVGPISSFIGEPPTRTYYLLESGQLPAGKLGRNLDCLEAGFDGALPENNEPPAGRASGGAYERLGAAPPRPPAQACRPPMRRGYGQTGGAGAIPTRQPRAIV